MKGIVFGLEKINFNTKAIRVEIDDITEDITFPAIAQILLQDQRFQKFPF